MSNLWFPQFDLYEKKNINPHILYVLLQNEKSINGISKEKKKTKIRAITIITALNSSPHKTKIKRNNQQYIGKSI